MNMFMNNSHKAQDQIVKAFFDLLEEKEFLEEFTINEVVEASKVARSSFYRYFNDIEDIVIYFFNQFYYSFEESYKYRFSEHIEKLCDSFAKIKENKREFQLLYQTGFLTRIEQYIWICAATCIDCQNHLRGDFHIRLLVYGYMTTLTRFLNENCTGNVKEVIRDFLGILKLNALQGFRVNRETIPVISVANMRESDAYTIANITPSKELMFRAGDGVFKRVNWGKKNAIVCGKGNNAGDGYVVADLLKNNGYDVKIFLVEEKFSEDGRYYFDIAVNHGVPYEILTEDSSLEEYDVIVDALLGTGFTGDVRGNIKTAIEKINETRAYVVSVDINSGLNGDNGLTNLAVISDLTISIGNFKTGHFLNNAKDYIKQKVNVNIGIDPIYPPYYLLGNNEVKSVLKSRKNKSNKGDFGYIALIGGSSLYSGAIRLSNIANSAMRAGGGVVLLATPKSISDYIIPNILESTIYPLDEEGGFIKFNQKQLDHLIKRCKTIAIGMGMGLNDEVIKVVDYLLENYKGNLIIDADGLNALTRLGVEKLLKTNARVILTPHIKEFSRLTGKNIEEIEQNPVISSMNFAKEHKCVLLLKGPTTIVTDGEKVYLVDRGCAGMATAGSGDVLSGILSSIVSYNEDNLLLATASGAYINGVAGELASNDFGEISMVASDTVSYISTVIKTIKEG